MIREAASSPRKPKNPSLNALPALTVRCTRRACSGSAGRPVMGTLEHTRTEKSLKTFVSCRERSSNPRVAAVHFDSRPALSAENLRLPPPPADGSRSSAVGWVEPPGQPLREDQSSGRVIVASRLAASGGRAPRHADPRLLESCARLASAWAWATVASVRYQMLEQVYSPWHTTAGDRAKRF